ncbi:MAG: hypothetical protein AMJ75_09405 [Phycisphaerae bacterium SM1_79]|nr:MAG: hypothetical protein AMJ75_09405 [Phycisphaerae bacterium SM1_79]
MSVFRSESICCFISSAISFCRWSSCCAWSRILRICSVNCPEVLRWNSSRICSSSRCARVAEVTARETIPRSSSSAD